MTIIFTNDPEATNGESDVEFWGDDVIEGDETLGIFDVAGVSANILTGKIQPRVVAKMRVENDESESKQS